MSMVAESRWWWCRNFKIWPSSIVFVLSSCSSTPARCLRVEFARSGVYIGEGSILDLGGFCLGGLCLALQSRVPCSRKGWGVRTLPFWSMTQQQNSYPVFSSGGSDGLASSFFGGVALTEGLSSVFLLRILGWASFAVYVALCRVFCWCDFEDGCGGCPFLFDVACEETMESSTSKFVLVFFLLH
jgi:hypothetical protein